MLSLLEVMPIKRGVFVRENEHSNISILKEIAELLNEETEIVTTLKGALVKFLNGTNFETGWIFFIDEKGRSELVVHENLPEALEYKNCHYLKKGGCWCVSRYRNEELKRLRTLLNVNVLKVQLLRMLAITMVSHIMQQYLFNRGRNVLVS